MSISQPAPGVVGPFAGLDVPWLLRMRAEARHRGHSAHGGSVVSDLAQWNGCGVH
jgi:hypothetical protein